MIIVVSIFKNDIQYIYVHVKFHAFGGPKENIVLFFWLVENYIHYRKVHLHRLYWIIVWYIIHVTSIFNKDFVTLEEINI